MTTPKRIKRKVAAPAKGRARQKAKKSSSNVFAPPAAITRVLPSSGFSMVKRDGNTCRIVGHEYLTQVVLEEPDEFLAAAYDMNPATWSGSRLVNIARSYEVYRFNKAKLVYVSATGTSTIGTMSIGFETDPNEPLPANGNFFQRSMANHYSALGPVWGPLEANYVRPSQDVRWWHASVEDGSRRDNTQLMAYAVTNAPVRPLVYGFLMVEYDVEFMYPELEFVTGAENFGSSVAITASASVGAGAPLEASFSNSTGARIIETIYNKGVGLGGLRAAGQDFAIIAGQSIYWAFNEALGGWRAYRTLEGARSNSAIITTIAGLAANALVGDFLARLYIKSFVAT